MSSLKTCCSTKMRSICWDWPDLKKEATQTCSQSGGITKLFEHESCACRRMEKNCVGNVITLEAELPLIRCYDPFQAVVLLTAEDVIAFNYVIQRGMVGA